MDTQIQQQMPNFGLVFYVRATHRVLFVVTESAHTSQAEARHRHCKLVNSSLDPIRFRKPQAKIGTLGAPLETTLPKALSSRASGKQGLNT